MTSHPIQNEDVLVVGGGDTAAEYVQYLHAQLNRVTLSYLTDVSVIKASYVLLGTST